MTEIKKSKINVKIQKAEKTQTKSFLKVRCHACEKEKVIFSRASTKVLCDCGEVLATPRGGKPSISAEIMEII